MRFRGICYRRRAPSTFTCLVLLFGVAVLTFTKLFYEKSAFVSSHLKFQHFVLDHKAVYAKDVFGKKKMLSTKHYQQDNVTGTVHQQTVKSKHDNKLTDIIKENNQNIHSLLWKNYITKTPYFLNSQRESKLKSDSIIHSSSNNSWTISRDNTNNAKKIRPGILETSNSSTPAPEQERHVRILEHLINTFPDSEHIQRIMSTVFASREGVSIKSAPVTLLNDDKLSAIPNLRYIDSLRQIIDNVTSSDTLHHSDYIGDVTNDSDSYTIPRNVRRDTFSTVYNGVLNVTARFSSNLSNENFTFLHSGTEKDTELRSNNILSRLKTFSRTKQLMANIDTYIDASRYNRKDYSNGLTSIVDGIYWSAEVEDRIPKGLSNQTADTWISRSRNMEFKSIESSTWKRCGRAKNGFAMLMDGTETCVRYRSPKDRLLQGEVMSYWLARLLNLDNVPPVYLSSVDSRQWAKQQNRFQELGWTKGSYVAAIMWINEIDSRPDTHVVIPGLLLKALRQQTPINASTFINSERNLNKRERSITWSVDKVISLAQWGSMIIFDYLTGNYDRVASMQDGAETEKKPSIIEESIRNLRKSKEREKLWLIDNECGLLDAYSLMYLRSENGQRFIHFHQEMLHTMCIFQRSIVHRLQAIHKYGKAYRILERYAEKHEPMLKHLERDSSYRLFQQHFSQRLDDVVKWISYCQQTAR